MRSCGPGDQSSAGRTCWAAGGPRGHTRPRLHRAAAGTGLGLSPGTTAPLGTGRSGCPAGRPAGKASAHTTPGSGTHTERDAGHAQEDPGHVRAPGRRQTVRSARPGPRTAHRPGPRADPSSLRKGPGHSRVVPRKGGVSGSQACGSWNLSRIKPQFPQLHNEAGSLAVPEALFPGLPPCSTSSQVPREEPRGHGQGHQGFGPRQGRAAWGALGQGPLAPCCSPGGHPGSGSCYSPPPRSSRAGRAGPVTSRVSRTRSLWGAGVGSAVGATAWKPGLALVPPGTATPGTVLPTYRPGTGGRPGLAGSCSDSRRSRPRTWPRKRRVRTGIRRCLQEQQPCRLEQQPPGQLGARFAPCGLRAGPGAGAVPGLRLTTLF